MAQSKRTGKLPALVIHAGAGKHLGNPGLEARARDALQRIASEAFGKLQRGNAVACVIFAVKALEDEPQFNAGTGAKLQSDGVARLTASLMDGSQHRFSGVINLEEVKNPVEVAKMLQREKDRVLGGPGAQLYARKAKFGPYNPVTEQAWSEWKRKLESPGVRTSQIYGTVGAVAVDRSGRLAAATSTGGKGMELVGRVSDSATVAGNYASEKAAVSATGVGEEIVESALAARIVTRVDDGFSLDEAFLKTFRELRKMGGRAGAIGVDFRGKIAVDTSTECILHAIRSPSVASGYP